MTNSLWRASFFFALALSAISACAQETADTIYTGGQILTINDAQPTAEFVAVRSARNTGSTLPRHRAFAGGLAVKVPHAIILAAEGRASDFYPR
jgi:hypothetical protein